MILDFRSALTSILTAFYTISLKLVDILYTISLKLVNAQLFLLYFDFNEEFEAFPKIAKHSWLIGSSDSIKFCQDKLKVLEV